MQYPLPSKTTLDDSLALLETVDLRNQLQQITLPFFQLYGRLDSLVPKTIPALVSELNPTSEQHIFLQASHAPFISHFDEFIEALTQWLEKTLIK
jgi:pimeloyl-[acyl-carrier protein] methyl ester esterase